MVEAAGGPGDGEPSRYRAVEHLGLENLESSVTQEGLHVGDAKRRQVGELLTPFSWPYFTNSISFNSKLPSNNASSGP